MFLTGSVLMRDFWGQNWPSIVQTVDSKDLEILIELFNSYWEIKSDEYQLAESLEIIFSSNLFKEEKLTKKIYKPNLLKIDEKSSFEFKVYKLPNTMDLTFLGDYMFTNDYTSAIVYKPNSKAIYHITLFDSYQLVELKLGDKIIISFKDIMLDSNNLNSFKRIIDSQEYIFENK